MPDLIPAHVPPALRPGSGQHVSMLRIKRQANSKSLKELHIINYQDFIMATDRVVTDKGDELQVRKAYP